MTEEEIKAMKEENEKLKTQVAEKDTRISDLEKITANQSTNFKSLKNMTKEQIDALTESERNALAQAEAALAQVEELKNAITEKDKASKAHVRDAYISRLVGNDQAKKDEIMKHYNRLSDEEQNDTDVFTKVNDAARLSGVTVDTNIIQSVGVPGQGNTPPAEEKKDDFSTTEAGKGLAEKMGIVVEAPKEGDK